MSNTMSVESALALDGRIFAMLTPAELELFKFYRDHGRKYGVVASIVSAADPVELAEAKTQAHQDEVMRRVNSTVSVVRSATDVFAEAAAIALEKFPPRSVTITQDKAQLERLYPKGGDGKSTVGSETQAAEPVWFLEERQLDGDWLAIDRADEQEEAEAKLRHAENCLPGTYRLQRSDW